jgi:hypothetical protein
MQDDIAESEVRDHGECMQQLYFFSIRLCWDVEIVYFISYFYASGESVSRRCRPKSSTLRSLIRRYVCPSRDCGTEELKTSPQAKKHWIPGPPLCWYLVVVKGL